MSGEEDPVVELTGMVKALKLFNQNRLSEAEVVCTELLIKNPLDQAAWALKLQCLSETAYTDELENEDVGIAEALMDQNVISANARPGTSFQRPMTTAKGINPILRPSTNAGRPLTGVVRPQSAFKTGTMDQAVRTARTAKTARAVSSTSARNMRLGTASMAAGADGEFVNLSRLNIKKYAADKDVNRQLYEYVFFVLNDVRVALEIANAAARADYPDWFWKNQLAKCYMRLGMFSDAERQLQISIQIRANTESYALLAKLYNRMDQPLNALKTYSEGLEKLPEDPIILTGMARVQEALGEFNESITMYNRVLSSQANNIEALACVATSHYYAGKPEVALRFYRQIFQMGMCSPELLLNIGLCCFASQQYDLAISTIVRAQSIMTEDVAADVWYNIGNVMCETGDLSSAVRAYLLALNYDADHSESMINLGVLKFRQGKKNEGRSLLASAVSKNPASFEGNFNLAQICLGEGKYDECRKCVLRALEVFPGHEPCKKMMAQLNQLYQSI